MVSVEGHPLWPTYKALVDRLKAYDFCGQGRLGHLQGTDGARDYGVRRRFDLGRGLDQEPVISPEGLRGVLRGRTHLLNDLQNRRHNQPDDETGVYARLCALQKHIGDEEELGTNMMEPVRLWVEGHYVHQICIAACDASPGHVCKTVQRLVELLGQMEEAAGRVNDDTLADLCDRTVRKVRRGWRA